MDTERRGSKHSLGKERRKSVSKISKLKGPSPKSSLPIKERTMSVDLESVDMKHVKRSIRYENTYRLEPKDDETFSCSKMEKVMKDIMEETIGHAKYDPIMSHNLVNTLSNQIKDRAKLFPWKRYRFVVYVIIGQNHISSVKIGSRCVWDDRYDNFASARYENKTLFAVANCYAIYLD